MKNKTHVIVNEQKRKYIWENSNFADFVAAATERGGAHLLAAPAPRAVELRRVRAVEHGVLGFEEAGDPPARLFSTAEAADRKNQFKSGRSFSKNPLSIPLLPVRQMLRIL